MDAGDQPAIFFELLIRAVLSLPRRPAIIWSDITFWGNKDSDLSYDVTSGISRHTVNRETILTRYMGESRWNRLQKDNILRYYDLPFISTLMALSGGSQGPCVESRMANFQKALMKYDDVHLTPYGHKIVATIVGHVLTEERRHLETGEKHMTSEEKAGTGAEAEVDGEGVAGVGIHVGGGGKVQQQQQQHTIALSLPPAWLPSPSLLSVFSRPPEVHLDLMSEAVANNTAIIVHREGWMFTKDRPNKPPAWLSVTPGACTVLNLGRGIDTGISLDFRTYT